jgi:hypothetical protein
LTTPYPPSAAQPANDKTTLFGVLGIVFALCCPIVGIIFSALSLNAAKKAGKPQTLAIIGFVVAALSIIVGIIVQVSARS